MGIISSKRSSAASPRHRTGTNAAAVFGIALDAGRRVDLQPVVADRDREQAERCLVAISGRRAPLPLLGLSHKPVLDVLLRNPFGRSGIEIPTDNGKLKF